MSMKPLHYGLIALGILGLMLVVIHSSGENESDLRYGPPLDAAEARKLPAQDRLRRVVLELDRRMAANHYRASGLSATAQALIAVRQGEMRLLAMDFPGPVGEGVSTVIALSEAYRIIGAQRYADMLQTTLGDGDIRPDRFRRRWMAVWKPAESEVFQTAYLEAHLDDILPPR